MSRPGDRVLFGKYSGSEIKVDGEDLFIMREDEILGVITRAGAGCWWQEVNLVTSEESRDIAAICRSYLSRNIDLKIRTKELWLSK